IALRGWPVNTITRRPARLLAGNALVIGLGALTYLVLRNLAHWQPDAISAACGCIISATLIVAMLFDGWPAARLPPAPAPPPTPSPPRAAPRPHPGAHRPGRARTRPRPSRLRRQHPLDTGHPQRVDHHRRPQLHRSRYHPPRRHRAPLAIRPQDHAAEPMTSQEPSNRVVHRFVAAINDGDRDAFPATLTDDGN